MMEAIAGTKMYFRIEKKKKKLLVEEGNYMSKSIMELKWVKRRRSSKCDKSNSNNRSDKFLRLALASSSPSLVPIYVSTNPNHINPQNLSDLYGLCNFSCQRLLLKGQTQKNLDINKLRIALSHSSVLVSVFCKSDHHKVNVDGYEDIKDVSATKSSSSMMGMSDYLQKMVPVNPFNGELVGFGRAISDCGLTASIHDVMVIPSMRRMGIGQIIVQRIIRMLASREIYDISALCSKNERLFFEACGFGDDILGSTTMMYTKTTI